MLAASLMAASLPFLIPGLLLVTRPQTRLLWLMLALLVSLLSWFMYLVADWTVLSLYLRYLSIAWTSACLAISYPDRSSAPSATLLRRAIRGLTMMCCALFSLALLSGLSTVYGADDVESVRLASPLAGTHSYIGQGGNSELTNHHALVHAQRRALDVVTLDGWGRRMRGLFPAEAASYLSHGQVVLAPCTGVVVARRDGLADRPPLAPALTKELAGNFVALHCQAQDVTVLLAHLQPGLRAKEGDAVKVGAVLGRVGNSGNSSEPHLHIHAVRGAVVDHEALIGMNGEGLNMDFDGRRGLSRGQFLPPAR